jgi:conjugal transfer pilus assembly protein TraW
MMKHSLYLALGLCVGLIAQVSAEDLGTYRIPGAAGTSQPDRDGATVLRERMEEKYRTGEAQAMQKKLQERNVDAVVNPKPLAIRTDTSPRTKLYSLDYILPVDAPGAKRGAKVNVLKGLGRLSDTAAGLLLIDGRDDEQVNYAVAMSEKKPIKIVLTGGSPIKIGERYKTRNGGNGIPFYFDQKGMILSSLANWYGIRIESVPAYLSNGGNGNLRVDYGM